MVALSEQLPLPFSLFPSSSLTNSKVQPLHSTDCSLRPRKNRIRLKEEWWGPSAAANDREREKKQEESPEKRENKRRENKRRKSVSRKEDVTTKSRKGPDSGDQRRRGRTESKGEENGPISESFQGRQRQSRSPTAHSHHPDRRQSKYAASRSRRSRSPRSPRRSRRSRRSSSPRRRSPSPLPLRPGISILRFPLKDLQTAIYHSDYDTYLTQDPIDPLYSFSFHRAQVEFFCTASPVVNWSQRPQSGVFKPVTFWPLKERLLGIQPDLHKIRSTFPLKSVELNLSQQDRNHPSWGTLREVLKWLYGKKPAEKEVHWFVENAPDSLLALARLHADTIRYSAGSFSAGIDFKDYLCTNRSSSLNRVEKRALDLLRWLSDEATRGRSRWKNWWVEVVERDREGKVAQWREWLSEAERWRTEEDLDEWERERRAQGRWRTG